MKLRREQMQAFSRAADRSFEQRMFGHVNRHFPKRCAELGEADVREYIRHGMQRARSYDIVSERDICKYVDLMFVYGRDYDTNPKYPWAAEILNDRRTTGPTARTSRLFEAGKRNTRQAVGLTLNWKRR
jgi:hypothetical protein